MVLPHWYFYRDTIKIEGLPSKAKEDPSLHEMRVSPTGHQASISWSWGYCYFYYHYYYHYYYYGNQAMQSFFILMQ